MKKIPYIILAFALVITFLMSTNASGAEFISITSSGRTVNVLVPNDASSYSMDSDANKWRKLGAVSVYYYNDPSMGEDNLVAHYYGMRDLSSAYSIANKLDRQVFYPTRMPGYKEPTPEVPLEELTQSSQLQEPLEDHSSGSSLGWSILSLVVLIFIGILLEWRSKRK